MKFIFFKGFGLLAVTPFTCESLVETAFPVQESLSSNTLFLVANIVGEIETLIITPDCISLYIFIYLLIKSVQKAVGNYRMMILAIIFVVPFLYSTFLFKTEYKRTNMAIHKSMLKEGAEAENTNNSDNKLC